MSPKKVYVVRTFDSSGKEGVSALVFTKRDSKKLRKYYESYKPKVTVETHRASTGLALHGSRKKVVSLKGLIRRTGL